MKNNLLITKNLSIGKFLKVFLVMTFVTFFHCGIKAQTSYYYYTGNTQYYTVPTGVTSVQIDAYGAQGGRHYGYGGKGARVYGTITVTPGITYSIFVGGQGQMGANAAGGYNGGGQAGGSRGDECSGGGYSGIFLNPNYLVMAGGGGGEGGYSGGSGGDGGYYGQAGQNGLAGNTGGGGGTQSGGGSGGVGAPDGCQTPSGAGQPGYWMGGFGGAGGGCAYGGGGGGGGYYGGGGGGSDWTEAFSPDGAGGGGGSSKVPSGCQCSSGAREGNGFITITAIKPPPTVTTGTAGGETTTSVVMSGNNITDIGFSSVTARGVCWNTSGSPTISDTKTIENGIFGTGPFSATMAGLTANTRYYVKAYATNSEGTSYGNSVSVYTLPVNVTATDATNNTATSFTANWTAPSPAGNQVYTYTFEYADNIALINPVTSTGILSTTLFKDITGLIAGTVYYYHVRVVSSSGKSSEWSNTIKAASQPGVATGTAGSVTSTAVTISNNEITSANGSDVTESGVVYSKTANPTNGCTGCTTVSTDPAITSGLYSLDLPGLESGTTYYFKAYAINGIGTSYGDELSFTTLPADPASISPSGNPICNGSSTTLTANGDQGTVLWYSGDCGTTGYFASGASTTVNPSLTTTYFARNFNNSLYSAGCASITITVEQPPVSGTLTKSPDITAVCEGTNVSSALTAGFNGNGTDELQYRTQTGIGWSSWLTYISGNPISTTGLSVVEIQTYREADYCDDAATVTVNWIVDPTTVGGAVTGGELVCYGSNSTLLTLSGHVGSVQRWEWSTNGVDWNEIANTADTYTATDLIVNTQFRAVLKSGECLVENSEATEITVFSDYHISGYAKYNNNPKTPLNGLKITLKQGGTPIGTPVVTGITGFYEFTGLINGTYDLDVASAHASGLWQTWNGVNNTDYLLVARHAAGVSLLPVDPPVVRVTASVKLPHPAINSVDVTAIQYAAKYGWGYFDIQKWAFSGLNSTLALTGIQLNCANEVREIRGLCAGDVNGSLVPPYGIKQTLPSLELVNRGLLPVTQEIIFPVRAEQDMEIGAITLLLDFDASQLEITGVEMPGHGGDAPYFFVTRHASRVTEGILSIGWMSLNPVHVTGGESVLLIHARISNIEQRISNFEGRIRFTLNEDPVSELADAEGNVIEGAKLTIADAGHASPVTRHDDMLSVYPNPVSEALNIEYLMETEGVFNAELMNPQGVVVVRTGNVNSQSGMNKTTLNLRELPNGAYLLKAVCGESRKTVKVIVNR